MVAPWLQIRSHGTRRPPIVALPLRIGELLLPLPPGRRTLGVAHRKRPLHHRRRHAAIPDHGREAREQSASG